MADEPTNPLDAMAAAEEAALTAEHPPEGAHTADLSPGAPTPQIQTRTQAAFEDAEAPPPAPAEPPAVAPVTEPPTPPPVTPPEALPEAEPGGQPSQAWKAQRLAEKARKETQAELQAERQRSQEIERRNAELQQQLERAQQPPADEGGEFAQPDPLTAFDQRLRQVEQLAQARSLDDTLNQQARTFATALDVDGKPAHPDYEQALNYYIDSERREAEMTGELDVVADRIRQVAAPQVRGMAIERGITEADAARNLATAVLFEACKQGLVAGAQRIGKTVPEIVYERAALRGYQRGNGARTAAPANVPSAAEQVRTEQTEAAASSLAGMTTTSSPAPRIIRTRADFAALPPADQERYIERMDRERPNWERDLL